MKLNYIPDSNFPLVVDKPSADHVNYYIYEQHEVDPIVAKQFKTIDLATEWIETHFPDYKVVCNH